jgi:hypothetical protein
MKTAAGAGGTAIIDAKGVAVPAGANITVVAHLSEAYAGGERLR